MKKSYTLTEFYNHLFFPSHNFSRKKAGEPKKKKIFDMLLSPGLLKTQNERDLERDLFL